MERTLIIVPAYNEEKNIEKVINELKNDFSEADIIIVNDCSTDKTSEIVISANVPCLNLPFNMGYSSALQCGFKYAADHSYDYIVQFDGDGQHVAKEAKKLVDKIKATHADIVIGSRFFDKSQYSHPLFRRIGTAIFSSIIRVACKTRISDPTSGLQVLSRRCFSFFSAMDNYPEYPDANLMIEMLRKGFLLIEEPVLMRSRTDGVSMHSGIMKPIKYMILMFYSIFIIILKQRTKKTKCDNME